MRWHSVGCGMTHRIMQSATRCTDGATALAKEFLELRTSSPQQVRMFEAVWQGFLARLRWRWHRCRSNLDFKRTDVDAPVHHAMIAWASLVKGRRRSEATISALVTQVPRRGLYLVQLPPSAAEGAGRCWRR